MSTRGSAALLISPADETMREAQQDELLVNGTRLNHEQTQLLNTHIRLG